jgi:sugar O-acyltransferase, sialic acid O-acetyltransferase neuD family
MATINLFGASGHAKVIMDIIAAQGDKVDYLYDDAPHCKEIHGVPVFKANETQVCGPLIISIGSNRVRELISKRYELEYAQAVHPQAIISPSATISNGTVVMHGALIQSDACIGKHCIINSGASIDHECQIGDFVHISPHATLCGNVHVGEGSWIGAGATVIPGIRIGRWCTIGAGAVVIRDIPDGATAYGNPCKIKQRNMQLTDNSLGGGG